MKIPEDAWPLDVSPFLAEARRVVRRVLKTVPLHSAILDDWNAGTDKHGVKLKNPRIIWGARNCVGYDCRKCKLYHVTDVDRRTEITQSPNVLRQELCRTPPDYLMILPATCQQPHLNCKTAKQYADAFIAYFLSACISKQEIFTELAWIFGFRLLYFDEPDIGFNKAALLNKEGEIKRAIIGVIIKELIAKREIRRLRYVFSYRRGKQTLWAELAK